MTKQSIIEALTKAFEPLKERDSRRITLYTGAGGMDLIEECMEREFGMERIYVSKAPRFMKPFLKKSRTGKLYKKVYDKSRFASTGYRFS